MSGRRSMAPGGGANPLTYRLVELCGESLCTSEATHSFADPSALGHRVLVCGTCLAKLRSAVHTMCAIEGMGEGDVLAVLDIRPHLKAVPS